MADNDGRLRHFLSRIYRTARYKLQYWNKNVAEDEQGNDVIREFILSGKPGAVGRLGAVESRYIYAEAEKKPHTEKNLYNLRVCAGVFPDTGDSRTEFYREYTDALSQLDYFVAWSISGGGALYRKFCPRAGLVGFFSLEPFFYKNPWTSALKGKKVLIVHPFTDTIRSQYAVRERLFANPEMLPEFASLEFVKAIQSNAGNDDNIPFATWKEALDSMKREIASKDFDIAIIGAGSYGLPLAAYVKSLGKQAVHMAGVTQMLFGIKGRRWDTNPYYSRLFNENWVYPSDSETPSGKAVVEGGTYWK